MYRRSGQWWLPRRTLEGDRLHLSSGTEFAPGTRGRRLLTVQDQW